MQWLQRTASGIAEIHKFAMDVYYRECLECGQSMWYAKSVDCTLHKLGLAHQLNDAHMHMHTLDACCYI